MSDNMVNIRKFKEFASANLRPNSPLRTLILEDSDIMPAQEFVVKAGVWLRLLRRIEN
jgi:hypothetical protein